MVVLAAFCSIGCGEEAETLRVTAPLSVQSGLHDKVRSIKFFVFAPRDQNDVVVTCNSLVSLNFAFDAPSGPVTVREPLVWDYLDFTGATAGTVANPGGTPFPLDTVEAGVARLLYLSAFGVTNPNSGSGAIGSGCVQNVTVPAGGSFTVRVQIQ